MSLRGIRATHKVVKATIVIVLLLVISTTWSYALMMWSSHYFMVFVR